MSIDFTPLRRRMTGDVILPDEAAYDRIRKWFIGCLTETLPQAIALCRTPGDVHAAVVFAREHDMPFALRSGAHSFAEFSVCDGLVIDMDELDGIVVDGDTVTTGPGVRIGPLADVLADHNRVVPFGWCTMVAVAGSSMGGGFGPLGRYYGLACDHLVAADVVLADGTTVRTTDEHEPDLLWALRGAGGGNFGAVTSLTFRTRPSVPAIDVAAWWPAEHAAAVIDGWQRWAPTAPRHVNAELVLRCWPDPDSEPILSVFGLMVDTSGGQANRHVADLVDLVGMAPQRVTYTELSARELPTHHTFAGEPVGHAKFGGRPAEYDHGVRFVKSEFFDGPAPRDAVAELAEHLLRDRSAGQQRELEFIPWGAEIGRPSPTDTAFVHRGAGFLLEHTVQAQGSATLQNESLEWARRSKEILAPWGNGRVYQNYPDRDLDDWTRAYYGDNIDRLRRIKTAYDPDNIFHFEQSVPPS